MNPNTIKEMVMENEEMVMGKSWNNILPRLGTLNAYFLKMCNLKKKKILYFSMSKYIYSKLDCLCEEQETALYIHTSVCLST